MEFLLLEHPAVTIVLAVEGRGTQEKSIKKKTSVSGTRQVRFFISVFLLKTDKMLDKKYFKIFYLEALESHQNSKKSPVQNF